ncbi:MAG: response regulator transcription factor [Acidimicrobiia bacterium]
MTVSDFPTTTPKVKALIVDDAPELQMLLEPLLKREGFEVKVAADGMASIEIARSFQPDVILLDLVMPGLDGIEVCRRIRTFSDAYIVMVTARNAEMDRVIGLTVGADDYLVKPFSPSELVARLRAMLRRPRTTTWSNGAPATNPNPVTPVRVFGDLTIDLEARQVTIGGHEVELTRIEFDLLATLCSRPRMVFNRHQLLELVWGPNWYGDTHVVDVHISNLRGKLGDRSRSNRYIETVRGVGFRLGDELTRSSAQSA